MKDDKAKFFACYWGQQVLRIADDLPLQIINHVGIYLNGYLELTPLSQITDEHAIELCAKLFKLSTLSQYVNSSAQKICYSTRELRDNDYLFDWVYLNGEEGYKSVLIAIDFLREKSYALPWLNYSVEEQISNGWVRLKK